MASLAERQIAAQFYQANPEVAQAAAVNRDAVAQQIAAQLRTQNQQRTIQQKFNMANQDIARPEPPAPAPATPVPDATKPSSLLQKTIFTPGLKEDFFDHTSGKPGDETFSILKPFFDKMGPDQLFKNVWDERKKVAESATKAIENDPTLDLETKLKAKRLREDIESNFDRLDIYDDPRLKILHNMGVMADFRNKIRIFNEIQTKKIQKEADLTDTGLLGGYLTAGDVPRSLSSGEGKGDTPDLIINEDARGYFSLVDSKTYRRGKVMEATVMPGDSEEIVKAKTLKAAALITVLAQTDSYTSDSDKKNAVRRIVYDAKGQPVRAFLNHDDEEALKDLVSSITDKQMSLNPDAMVGIDKIMAAIAETNLSIEADPNVGSTGGGGGQGFRRFGGGGFGGGGGAAARYTDPALVRQTATQAAQAVTGQGLTDEQLTEFLNFYHGLEQNYYAAALNGMEATQVDLQAQALEWVKNNFGQQRTRETEANMFQALAQMIASGGMGGPIGQK